MARKKQSRATKKTARKSEPPTRPKPPPAFPIVGIGASAGGLEALEALFAAMPADTGIGFVLVVHLDPTHISILPELLQKRTTMPVCQAGDGMVVAPDHVYVIPPNRELSILHGVLHLMDLAQPRHSNLPIDAFLRSLAQDQESNAICIILSGTGTDGTLGVRAIKGAVGMVMAQDEASAKYDGMPRSAIATGLVDYVLPPGQMPGQLLRYTQHAPDRVAPTREEGPPSEPLQKIFVLLRARTAHDFSLYKTNTICRRIERRMNVHQIDDLADYARHLQHSDGEAQALFKELLIGVTSFFRDAEAFEALRSDILPGLLDGKGEDDAVRVWVPGCASGEEAYSVAMALHECMEQRGRHCHTQVFGTDIDEDAIAAARGGVYPASILADVGADRIQRFFTKEEDGRYRVNKLIREMTVFAPQNVVQDPPFTKLDLLCCRNLLIYLGVDLQRKLLPIFHYSLKAGGVLFLGSSETIGPATELFDAVHSKWKIFRRLPSAAGPRSVLDVPVPPAAREAPDPGGTRLAARVEAPSTLQLVETILKQSQAPPCAIIDDAGDVVYIHGRTGRFLELAAGKIGVNVVDMARRGLKTELAAAIRQVATHRQESVHRGLRVIDPGGRQFVDITVKPILDQIGPHRLMMVLFEEAEAPTAAKRRGSGRATTGSAGKSQEELEQELQFSNESLQTTIEELETSNEELKSTNEELQSANEELQSTNEELETSKEELQSLNEESATVNVELQARIDELSTTHDDMKNLLDSTEIATVFLDTELRVRRFTPRATDIIPLTPSDADRPIRHLATSLVDVDLAEYGSHVLDDLAVREAEVESEAGRHYTMRIRPYRTVTNVIDGVVITFEDTTERHKVGQALRESEKQYRTLFELSSDAIVVIDAQTGDIAQFSRQTHERLGYTREEFAALAMSDIEAVESADDAAKHLARVVASGSDVFTTRHRTKDGRILDVQTRTKAITVAGKAMLLGTWHGIVPTSAEAGPS